MNIETLKEIKLDNLSIEDKWILTKYEKTLKDVTKHMEKYEFNIAGSILYSFIWDDFCSSYIELSKRISNLDSTKSVLCYVLTGILKMLHPFMPFVTEEIYNMLPIKDAESIMISEYPTYNKEYVFTKEEKLVNEVLKDIVAIRNLKATNGITKEAIQKVLKVNKDLEPIYVAQLKIVVSDADVSSLDVASYESDNIKISYYFEKTKDDNKDAVIASLKASIERREKLLSNENYVNKAPANIVEADRQKLAEEKAKLELLLK